MGKVLSNNLISLGHYASFFVLQKKSIFTQLKKKQILADGNNLHSLLNRKR